MKKSMQNKSFDFSIKTLIVGMGVTGVSSARYLKQRNCPFDLADSRFDCVLKEFSDHQIISGEFSFESFKSYKQIIVSPGISIRSELFILLQKEGCLLLGDIELFAQVVEQPVIAITGSNGKSTVTTLVEKIAQACGIKAIAGGNLGIPALDLLSSQSDLYILELSSFQLETLYCLKSLSATVLNVSEDHMDRYHNLDDYRQVKETIYQYTENAVLNADESLTLKRLKQSMLIDKKNSDLIVFGSITDQAFINKKSNYDYSLHSDNSLWRANEKLLNVNELNIKGIYNYLNILAAWALLSPLDLDMELQLKATKEYIGLEHRCEWVKAINGIDYYNDSKGTNVGASIAAINAFTDNNNHNVILIAGGVAKEADFTALGDVIERKIKLTILLGVDAPQIKQCALSSGAKNDAFYHAESMSDAVLIAHKLAYSGDVILFSPACASFDMYQNYRQRGDDFKRNVHALEKDLKDLKEVTNVC